MAAAQIAFVFSCASPGGAMLVPFTPPSVNEKDIDPGADVLRNGWLTGGGVVPEFEVALADYVGAKYAVAFSSGTAALHASAFACGLSAGKRVATSPLTFVASANCARYVGANVEFVDIESATLNLDLALLPEDVYGLIAVHYAGLPLAFSRMR